MAIPLVQVGQCGNQVGGCIYETVIGDLLSLSDVQSRQHEEYKDISRKRFFSDDETWKCRAVMVDTEEKVVNAVENCHRDLIYPKEAQLTGKRGCGNNWASGYCENNSTFEDIFIDIIRKIFEQCDRVDGILFVMSLAGGTGSGLGTKLCGSIRDAFPESYLMSLPVWPFHRGEVSVQSYNAILTLSHLQTTVDALLLFENDTLHDICKRRLGVSNVSVNQLNQVIGHQVASLLQPCKDIRNALSSIISHAVPHPDFKLLQIRSIPYMDDHCREFATDQWKQITRHLNQMLIADAFVDEGIDWTLTTKSRRSTQLSTLLTLRGQDVETASVGAFTDKDIYPNWRRADDCSLVWSHHRPFRLYNRCASLLSNGQCCLKSLNTSISRAWSMFSSKAFVHQYVKHGFSEADFLDSFAMIEQIVYNYENINK